MASVVVRGRELVGRCVELRWRVRGADRVRVEGDADRRGEVEVCEVVGSCVVGFVGVVVAEAEAGLVERRGEGESCGLGGGAG